MSRRTVLVAVTLLAAVAATTGAAAYARATRTPASDPAAPVVHRSDQNPADVQRYWTPERIREADENMRHGPRLPHGSGGIPDSGPGR